MLPVPPPLLLVARTLLPMTLATRLFRHPPLPLARSPHAGAPASDSAFWGRHQILRDALLPAPRAFVPWVSLVPMPLLLQIRRQTIVRWKNFLGDNEQAIQTFA